MIFEIKSASKDLTMTEKERINPNLSIESGLEMIKEFVLTINLTLQD